jgi:cell division cycle 2-like protein
MATNIKSRWADEEEDAEIELKRKQEKEAKKKLKAENQRKLEEAAKQAQPQGSVSRVSNATQDEDAIERPVKRRRLSADGPFRDDVPHRILRFTAPEWGPCRHVDNFEKLNHIEEGSYGWVSRAKETATGEIVALKKLKMDNANDGFPVTGLREIQTLLDSRHEGIVHLREIVTGDSSSE